MLLKYALPAGLCFVLLFLLAPAHAQVDFSQEKEFFLQNDSIKMILVVQKEDYSPKRTQGIFWDFDKGFECFFAFQSIPVSEVFAILEERGRSSKGIGSGKKSGRLHSALTFFNVLELDALLREKNWSIHAMEIKKESGEKRSKEAFKKGCKELLLKFLDLKELPCNVGSYHWKINTASLEKKNALKFDQELDSYNCIKKIKGPMLVMEDARIIDVLAFIENRYYKRITVAYEKGYHPIWLGNYRFQKIKFPLDYSFEAFVKYLSEEYAIELKPAYGDYKGKAYSPKKFKEEEAVKFEDYEIYQYEDEFIKVDLRFSEPNRSTREERPITTNYEEVYIGAGVRRNKALEYLHYGGIRTGERSVKLNKVKEATLFFQLGYYGQNVELLAENLVPDEIEEEEFRKKVEKVFLDKLKIEKKMVDQVVYKCTYRLDRIKELDNFSVVDTKDGFSIKHELNYNNRDTIIRHFLLPPDPKLLVNLRMHGYDLLFQQNDWSNYQPQLEDGMEQSMEYYLSDLQLPRNDLDNLIFILDKKYGILLEETEKRKPVILYQTKN